MSKIIKIGTVRDFIPISASDAVIQLFIDLLAEADTCLDSQNISDTQIRALKLYSIAHLLVMQEGGQVKSETDMDGASVTFETSKGDGFGATSYGRTAMLMPGYGCVSSMLDRPRRFAGAIG